MIFPGTGPKVQGSKREQIPRDWGHQAHFGREEILIRWVKFDLGTKYESHATDRG